jgi:predicted NBD/HSP70 family sugar kinase
MSSRATPPLLKDLNERTVLEAIRAGAPISRAEISRRVGISKPTVSLALRALLHARLVREAERLDGGPSYGATFFEPVPDAAFVLGIDLGTRFVRGAVCDLRGEVRTRSDVELPRPTAETALETIAELVQALVGDDELSAALDGVVLGVPGAVDSSTGEISLAENVVGLEGGEFRRALDELLSAPLWIDNDINLAALGERWRGVARGVDDFAFLSVGTGLGAGLVLRGELHRGHRGTAGELDYIRSGLREQIDPCAGAVTELARALAEDAGGATSLALPFDTRAIFAAARAGDAVARRVVVEEARRIALHIAPIAAVTDVRLVVLGGGIGANGGDLLLDEIRPLLAGWLPYPPRLETSSLGDAAVLTGALAVGLRAARENVFVNRARS